MGYLFEVLPKFPWRKDEKLYQEAKSLSEKRVYEVWTIFIFGFQLGTIAEGLRRELGLPPEKLPFDLVFRVGYPDAILINENTKETLNIEFEEVSSLFHYHKHDPEKCHLIVCFLDDWDEEKFGKRPVDTYELSSGRLYKASKEMYYG